MRVPFELLQVTAEYSNAVLVAIMPYVSDFAHRLELPIPQPITVAEVSKFGCSPRSDHIGGRVFLTNGYSFTFDRGAVRLFSSPSNYFGMQDPARVPEFYAPVKLRQDEAVGIARGALRRLGYTEAILHFDAPPKVTPPLRSEGKHVARYLVSWLDPLPEGVKPTAGGIFRGHSAEVEVDATTGKIHMLSIAGKDARRPDPKISVRPPVLAGPPQSQPTGGTRITAVSPAYARAFLAAILPQLTDYVKKTGVEVKVPITLDDVDLASYSCGLVRNDPSPIVYLKSGDRFVYCHGQVVEFEAHDSIEWSAPNQPYQDKPHQKFYGPINVSTEQALAVARKALDELGYPSQIPRLRKPPQWIVPPRKEGTNYFARYFFTWPVPGGEFEDARAEVDGSSGKLKSLYVDDRTHTNIWRSPPSIDVPTGAATPNHEEPTPAAPLPPGTAFSMPAPSLPPPKLPGRP